MKRVIVLVGAVCIGFSFVGCTYKEDSHTSAEKTAAYNSKIQNVKISTTQEFAEQLRKMGYKIKITKQNNEALLSGILTRIDIDGDTIGCRFSN